MFTKSVLDGRHHFAFARGKLEQDQPTVVRVHSENLLSDVFQMEKTHEQALLTTRFNKSWRKVVECYYT